MNDKYVLTLTTSKGEIVTLTYDTSVEAVAMRQAFMNTGDYCDAVVTVKK